MDLINPIDREALKQQVRNAKPFPHLCIDNFLNESFANEVHDAFPTYEDAKKIGKAYYKVNENKKIQITDANLFSAPIQKLNALMASPEFLEMISDLMDIPNLIADPNLIGGGIHETNSGGHLDVHIDFNYIKEKQWHRRLNMLIYFNKNWADNYGGFFDIWDQDVKQCYGSYAPIFNRAFIFATSNISFHGVTPLTCPPDVMRKSFATYFYTKEAPSHWDGQFHSTIFKPRPDEWLKGNVLMPYEKAVTTTKNKIKDLKNSIKSTFK